MKRILTTLCVLFCVTALFAANPPYEAFLGTNGIRILSNPPNGKIIVDGSGITNGASAVFVTTNLFVVNNTYTSNLFTTNLFVNQTLVTSNLFVTNLTVQNVTVNQTLFVISNIFVSNLYATNITVNNLNVTSNLFVTNLFSTNIFVENITVNSNLFVNNTYATNIFVEQNIFTTNLYATNIFVDQDIITSNFFTINNFSSNITVTNIFVNQTIISSNIFVTNLVANTIISKDILWTNDNGTVRLIDQSRVGIGTNSADSMWVLEAGTNVINAFTYATGGVQRFVINSNGEPSLLKGITYSWPTAQGAAGTVLTNDGAGVLGWGASSGGSATADIWTNRAASGVIIPSPNYTFRGLRAGFRTSDSGTPSWDSTNVGIYSTSFGSNNQAGGAFSSVLSGRDNLIPTNQVASVIVGGRANFFQPSLGFYNMIGVAQNVNFGVAASNSVVVGGQDHIVDANLGWAFIGGGTANRVRQQHGVVVGGQANETYGQHNFLGGGANNLSGDDSTDTYVVVGGGDANLAKDDHTFIGGGAGNLIFAGASHGVLSGGRGNTMSSVESTISGGALNQIENLADGAVIGGGYTNYISTSSSAVYAAIPGGVSNRVTSAPLGWTIGSFGTNSTPLSILLSPAGTHGSNRLHVTATATTNIGPLKVSAGNAFVPVYAGVGGTLTNSAVPIVNAGTAETNMITANIPANVLTNGSRLNFRAAIRFAATADNKAFTVTYGSEVIYSSGTVAQNDGDAVLTGEIIATGNLSQSCNVAFSGNGAFDGASTSETAQTNGIATILKITATGAASGVITNRSLVVEWKP